MKIAVIDLGTNTFHLVISQLINNTYEEVTKKQIYVRLIAEELGSSIIMPGTWQCALDSMKEFRRIIDAHQVNTVYAVGTSALRSASNGAELITAIEQQTNIQVEIISGQKEAALIYRGVKEAVTMANNEIVLIMDIGGGSVEFIICDNNKPLWKQSFEVGVQRLISKFTQNTCLSPVSLSSMEKYLTEHLQPLFQAVVRYLPTRLIGSSGAFRTIGDILKKQRTIFVTKEATSYDIPFEKFVQLYQDIRYTTLEERLQMLGLFTQPLDMIAVSTAVIYFVLNTTNLCQITASKYSLKVGLFYHALEKIKSNVC